MRRRVSVRVLHGREVLIVTSPVGVGVLQSMPVCPGRRDRRRLLLLSRRVFGWARPVRVQLVGAVGVVVMLLLLRRLRRRKLATVRVKQAGGRLGRG